MKKFLKTLVIIILVVASIGGTAYIFFANIKPETNYFSSLNSYVDGADHVEFLSKLQKVAKNSNDGRFSLIINTNTKLDECLQTLSSYYIAYSNYDVDVDKLQKLFSNMQSNKNQTENAMDTYLTKITAQGQFIEGANPTYRLFSNYILSYANLLNFLNGELKNLNINKNVDLKFSLIDLYCQICSLSFSDLAYSPVSLGDNIYSVLVVRNDENITKINDCLEINNSYVGNENAFSLNAVNFIKSYNACDKQKFSSSLIHYIKNGKKDDADNELVAGYYFKQIFGE